MGRQLEIGGGGGEGRQFQKKILEKLRTGLGEVSKSSQLPLCS